MGRKESGKTSLIKKILNEIPFDNTYLINVSATNNIDEELNMLTYSIHNFDLVYNNIIYSEGKKLLIVENFYNLHRNLFEDHKYTFNDLVNNNQLYNLTIIFVSNNIQFQANSDFSNKIDILFLSSAYFNIHNFVNNSFSMDMSGFFLEKLVNEYIENYKYLVFTNNSINYL